MDFKTRLKELRMARHLTQVELAKRLNLSPAAISMYENGQREPNFETEEFIADYFNVDLDYLRGVKDTTTEVVTNDTHLLFQIFKRLDPHARDMVTAYAQGLFDILQEQEETKAQESDKTE